MLLIWGSLPSLQVGVFQQPVSGVPWLGVVFIPVSAFLPAACSLRAVSTGPTALGPFDPLLVILLHNQAQYCSVRQIKLFGFTRKKEYYKVPSCFRPFHFFLFCIIKRKFSDSRKNWLRAKLDINEETCCHCSHMYWLKPILAPIF